MSGTYSIAFARHLITGRLSLIKISWNLRRVSVAFAFAMLKTSKKIENHSAIGGSAPVLLYKDKNFLSISKEFFLI